MGWGAFGDAKNSMLAFLEVKQNSEKYVSSLENYVVPFLDELGGDGLTFQQDNATIHQSRYTKAWLADQKFSVIDWPASSPD